MGCMLLWTLLDTKLAIAQDNGEEPEPIFFEDFNDEELPDGWTLINFGDEGREWIFLEPTEPVRLPGEIGTGYTIFEPGEGGIALAEAVGTLNGPNVHIGMQTPAIDMSELDEVILRFDQQLRGAGTSFGLIEVSLDGEQWNEVATITSAGDFVDNGGLFDPLELDIFPTTSEYNLTEFAAGESEVYIRFVYNDNNGSAFWWIIDNVEVFEPLPRPNPAVIVSPADGATDLRLTTGVEWAQGSGVTPQGYFFSFGTDEPPTNIEDMIDVGTETSYQPEGELEYSTTYFWQVVPYDAEGVIEDEIAVWSFTTKDDPVVTELPYNEIFEDTSTPELPIAWRFEDANENGITWVTTSFRSAVGENSARVGFDQNNPKDDWLFSPAFEFEPGNTYEVTFQAARAEFIAPRVEKLKVHLATGTSSDLAFEEPFFNDDNIVSEAFIELGGIFTVDEADRYHLAFHAYSDAAQRELYLDDINVRIVPPEPDLVFSPESLEFDELFEGGEQSLMLSFTNEGAEDLEIDLSIGDDENFSFSETSVTVAYNTIETVLVTFNPQTTGDLSTSITLETNDPNQASVAVPVSASAIEAPIADVNPDELNVEVTFGTSGSAEFVISNTGGSPLTYGLNSLPPTETSERGTDEIELIRQLQQMPTVNRGVSGSVFMFDSEAGGETSAGLLQDGVVIQDSLFYDAPGLTPEQVVGIPDPDLPFWGATRFTAEEQGFYMTHVRNWMRAETAGSSPVLIQVYRGGDAPAEGTLEVEQTFTITSGNGESSLIELNQPVLFEGGEDFWVVFRFSTNVISPQGINIEMDPENSDRFAYFFPSEQEWIELPDDGWAYKMRAVSAGLDWIEFDAVSGVVEAGEEQTVTVTANSAGFEIGSFDALINVFTNDPMAAVLPVSLTMDVVEPAGDAFVQIIHNAADPAFDSVDIFVNGEAVLPQFSFRDATDYLPLPAETELEIAISAAGDPVEDAVFTETYVLDEGEVYQLFANGVFDPDAFPGNPDGESIAFDLFVFGESRLQAEASGVDIAVFHGTTDAPAVQVSSGELVLVEEAVYGSRTGYLSLPADAYTLDLTDAATGDPLGSFLADVSMLEGEALTVMASGFVTPGDAEGRNFGLFAVLADGQVLELENVTSTNPGDEVPNEFTLNQNYPNPFNPTTQITYALPEAGEVTLEVFNLQGQRVAVLVNGQQNAGQHTVSFDATHLASGMYLYRLQSGSFVDVRKMMLVK